MDTCHCGSPMKGQDHCPYCFCEQFERTCDMVFPTVASAASADDLLTALTAIAPDRRYDALSVCGVKILRAAADLCGEDSVGMGKRAAIKAIVNNF